MIENGLVEHDEQIAVRQRQTIVRAAAERRRPIAMGDQLGPRAVGNIDHHHAGVAPGGVSGIAMNDRMMQSVPARRGPRWRLARGPVYAPEPAAPALARGPPIA